MHHQRHSVKYDNLTILDAGQTKKGRHVTVLAWWLSYLIQISLIYATTVTRAFTGLWCGNF